MTAAALLYLYEALKLCPGALQAKGHSLSCLQTKRRMLSTPCRGVYDQVTSFLRGGDVQLDLRALRKGAGAVSSKAE